MEKNYKWVLSAALIVCTAFKSSSAVACGGEACVTPTELTAYLTKVTLVNDSSASITIYENTGKAVTFKKSDSDFVEVDLGSLTIPSGRYVKGSVTFGNVDVKLSSETIKGSSGSLSDGAVVCTTATTGTVAACGTAVTANWTTSAGNNFSFPKPICIGSTGCQTGDTQVAITGTIKLSIMADLYNSVPITASSGVAKLGGAGGLNLAFPVNGAGAAIHMSYPITSGKFTEQTLLFDSTGSLLYANSMPAGSDRSSYLIFSDYCMGSNNVTIKTAPSGSSAYTGSGNYTSVSRSTATTSTLKVEYPNASGYENSKAQVTGMTIWPNLKVAVGGAVSVQCLSAVTTPTDLAGLGYTYELASTSGNGSSTNSNLVMKRIVDTSKTLFSSVCTTTNSSGNLVCGSYP